MKRRPGLWRAIAASILVLGLDQGAKAWALDLPTTDKGVAIGPFVRIVQAWNTGINFGLLESHAFWQPYLLASIAILVGGGLLWWTSGNALPWHNFACGAVTGGALSNGIDRLVHGAVHDYLNVSCCNIENPYAFNLADTAIVLGLLPLLLRR